MNGERGRFSEETCPVCHKTFVVPDAGIWAYKLRRYKKGVWSSGYIFLCSWKCFRSFEGHHAAYVKKHDGRRTRHRKEEGAES